MKDTHIATVAVAAFLTIIFLLTYTAHLTERVKKLEERVEGVENQLNIEEWQKYYQWRDSTH
uniref:hypothetical protein n=1 Tax=Shewanella gaetbuli TaxID=220752 RepID=UPI003B5BF042